MVHAGLVSLEEFFERASAFLANILCFPVPYIPVCIFGHQPIAKSKVDMMIPCLLIRDNPGIPKPEEHRCSSYVGVILKLDD